MIKQFMKSILFVVLITPLASLGMEPQPDRIELGKELALVADQCDWATAENLIAKGADVNQTFQGWTPLMYAVRGRQEWIMQLLIDADADLNFQSRAFGWTALFIAIATKTSADKFAQILINANADLHLRVDNQKQTALMMAAEYGNSKVCSLLIEAMLKPTQERKERIYTLLKCLQQMPRNQYVQLRDNFKPYLHAMIQEPRQITLQEINRIKDGSIRNQLLEKYGFRPISNSEAQQ